MKLIDKFLNETAMYYLVLRGLAGLALLSVVFGFFKLLPFSALQFIITFGVLVVACFFGNILISKILKAPINRESSLITALILFFVLAPVRDLRDIEITIAAGLIAMVSKYIFAINRKHIFNPAAIAVLILGFLGFGNAIWWVGSTILLPFVLVMGLLVVRKIRRFSLFFSFLIAAILVSTAFNLKNGLAPLDSIAQVFLSWPVIFFGSIMLTEPQTTPPHRKLQIVYGALVGLLFGSQFEIGPVFSSPELSLILGNVFSFIVSPHHKLFLNLKEKRELVPGTIEFSFARPNNFSFLAGQYLEWTLPHKNPDNRGTRRYFTIASSPTEEDLKLGVRMARENGSTFKNALANLEPGAHMVATQLSGDFVLPTDQTKKLVFIAGGIGVTPFRSILKYLADKNEKRDIVLFYAVTDEKDIVYKDLFKNIKFIPVITPKQGFITEQMIKKEVPDYKERMFYLSGPNSMVDSYKELIKKLGIPNKSIITDYFPGF